MCDSDIMQDDSNVYLHGLNIKYFRGIGEHFVEMKKFKKINLFIGQNNSGKSTVLYFIQKYVGTLQDNSIFTNPRKKLDAPYIHPDKNTTFQILYPAQLFFSESDTNFDDISYYFKLDDMNNIVINCSYSQSNKIEHTILCRYEKKLDTDKIFLLAKFLYPSINEATYQIDRNTINKNIYKNIINKIPNIRFVPTLRSIVKGESSDPNLYSGQGLIEDLNRLQSPTIDNYHDKEIFYKISNFLKVVISNPTALIHIPYDLNSIIVEIDGKALPLSHLGTGISEVIMIAAFCTISQNEIICIEEPETHLHPILQKKLIRYLSEQTSNQYFIATHSASFIDTPNAAIFHVYLENNETKIKEAILNADKYNICHQLGYKASDILQANCVVWVEGPSELIYLRYWIECVDSSLVEGIHYSVMFYGGRLLSHLSGDGEEQDDSEKEDVQKFIQLPSLNRNSLIIMDSDKTKEDDEINETKKRIKKEFEKNTGYVWITQGREIENYLNYNDIQGALKENHPNIYGSSDKSGQYDHAFFFKRKTAPDKIETSIHEKADKVKIAQWIVKNDKQSFGKLDLNDRIYGVVNFIRKANGLDEIEIKAPPQD